MNKVSPISKLLKIVFVIIFVSFPFQIEAQIQDTVFIHADSLDKKNVSLNNIWKYHLGDDSTWALPSFDHSNWDTINVGLDLSEVEDSLWTGIGWFRKYIEIDSALINKTVGLRVNHWGASEIYLNGELKKKFRQVSPVAEEEKPYQPNNIPVAVQLDSNSVYLIAVRYSNHMSVNEKYSFQNWFGFAGFHFSFRNIDTSIIKSVENTEGNIAINAILNGLFLSLSLLYFLLFLFYQRKKENLFYSFFTFMIVILFLAGIMTQMIQEDLNLIRNIRIISNVALTFIFVSYLAFLYSIFSEKFPVQFWIFLVIASVLSSLIVIDVPEKYVNYPLFIFIMLTTIESLRLIVVSIRNKKSNSWVIGAGVLVFVSLIAFIFILALLGTQNVSGPIALTIFFAGLLSLPASMSIYLARDIAVTNKKLQQKIVAVKDLSEKQIEQEKRNAELKIQKEIAEAENERKTKELEEARELQLSLLPKEIPNLPNLDIAVYMKTATEVGGDYYDFHVALDGTLTVVLGDATGHGMKAGTMVTATKSLFNSFAGNDDILLTFTEMSRCLKQLNFTQLSMCIAMLKMRQNKIRMSSAGIPPIYIYRNADKSVEEFFIKGMPLGTFSNFPYDVRETTINSGDTILMLSDGFPELMNSDKELYGYKKIKNEFGNIATSNPEDIIDYFIDKGNKWTDNAEPNDDITFLVLKAK